ncbi:MAG: ketoacyl-ACP synthase III [Burkholderiales bacterium]|nr:ketoacyl-ACP synthase III [Burkholderiales bacterium]
MYSSIIGTGSYLPEKILTNDDLAQIVETSDEWICARTGIRQRHIAADDQNVSDLALIAARRALENAKLSADEIDLIVLATTTPEMTFPSTACIVQEKLGMTNGAAAFDVQAVCSGFIYALATADSMIRSGVYRRALVIGAEVMSRIVDWKDRKTCVLFGDGAGAVVLEASAEVGVLSSHLHADGRFRDILKTAGRIQNGEISGLPYIEMDGGQVFRFAVRVLADCVQEALEFNGLRIDDIDWLIPHQANQRIMDATARKLRIAEQKMVSTVGQHANTSSASIPLAIDAAAQKKLFKKEQLLALVAVGGGFTWGATLLRWRLE